MKSLHVAVGPRVRASRARPAVRVCVAERALQRTLVQGISTALDAAIDAAAATTIPPMTTIGSVAEATRVRARLQGNLAGIDLARTGAGRLRRVLAAVDVACPAGVQLVWASRSPLDGATEAAVFAILEERRGDSDRPPVILARAARPASVWRQVLTARLAAQETIR
jgi:hypothetical protein